MIIGVGVAISVVDGTFSTRGLVQLKHFKPSHSVLFEQEPLTDSKLKLLKVNDIHNIIIYIFIIRVASCFRK